MQVSVIQHSRYCFMRRNGRNRTYVTFSQWIIRSPTACLGYSLQLSYVPWTRCCRTTPSGGSSRCCEHLPHRSLPPVTVVQISIPFLLVPLVPLDSAPYFRAYFGCPHVCNRVHWIKQYFPALHGSSGTRTPDRPVMSRLL